MSIFDDDPFENILEGFFGRPPRQSRNKEQFIRGEEEDRVIDFVEDGSKVYLVFELTGYTEKDVLVVVKNNELQINAQKRNGDKVQDYLMQKLHNGVLINKALPKFINPKKFSHTMRNGILEVVFERK
ncbi:MAG: Hsp20/alpha crystallin family protein [archaeon]